MVGSRRKKVTNRIWQLKKSSGFFMEDVHPDLVKSCKLVAGMKASERTKMHVNKHYCTNSPHITNQVQ
jgi:hypothetical protein